MARPFGSKNKYPRRDKSTIPFMERRATVCKKYEKTKSGFLMRTYRNMLSRVKGIQKLKAHLYFGLSIMPKKEFYEWAKSDKTFNVLFDIWTGTSYARTLSPSIDRIDAKLGYVKGNVRWITHSQNSRLGSQSRQSSRTSTTASKL